MGLSFDVFSSRRPGVNRTTPPGLESFEWVPTTSTLIYGVTDAVLVDTQLTTEAANSLADWVAAKGTNLTTIYITHGHGDHFFGNSILLKRFPDAKIVSTQEVVSRMRTESSSDRVDNFWNKLFPGEIPDNFVYGEPLQQDEIELEGEKLAVVRIGHTDCDDTTALWAPSIGLLVAGDSVYGNTYPYLGESVTQEARSAWITALDRIADLQPKFVVGGHSDPEKGYTPIAITETKGYLEDFERIAQQSTTAEEIYNSMLHLHPGRLNPGSLWGGAALVATKAAT
ncbi:beta-lactamase-like protein [Aspergillus caelatus]|uniref:Beta-lactamase-like protein n=1 Tax=Aspergillus caelatus TaxID=61420 RepID=A0A5N6ZVZ0_9EURO|nr:beta-lactamase-like protein [Aspergillus caelatus]KAE8361672.1 beta-lactamase-like protein [Aspergillus caelatus]